MIANDDIAWFKKNFHAQIDRAIARTVFSLDLLTAIACQETAYIWRILRKKPALSVARVLELCVGDTLDSSSGRSAFPRTKTELLELPSGRPRENGQAMFDIARRALVDMAEETQIQAYLRAAGNRNKFCHGFGIFQYDLQAFLREPDYFLSRRWSDFDASLAKCVEELNVKLRRIGYDDKPRLTDLELVHVAIAYNSGNFIKSKGLKQGHFDGEKFYGEYIFEFLRQSKTVPVPGEAPAIPPPPAGTAPLPPPEPISGSGTTLRSGDPNRAAQSPPRAGLHGEQCHHAAARRSSGARRHQSEGRGIPGS